LWRADDEAMLKHGADALLTYFAPRAAEKLSKT
jgi:delta-aminolevulinic acid dehydratase/porphobilinogen synthase